MDTNVVKVPYGLFFYLLASQVSMILAYMRSADSSAIDSRLREEISGYGVPDVDAAERTFINEFEWFSPTQSEFERKKGGRIATFVFNLTVVLTSITALVFYVFPSAAGIYTLYNSATMIYVGNVDIQYWVIFGTTSLSILWFLNFIAVWSVVRKKGVRDASPV